MVQPDGTCRQEGPQWIPPRYYWALIQELTLHPVNSDLPTSKLPKSVIPTWPRTKMATRSRKSVKPTNFYKRAYRPMPIWELLPVKMQLFDCRVKSGWVFGLKWWKRANGVRFFENGWRARQMPPFGGKCSLLCMVVWLQCCGHQQPCWKMTEIIIRTEV
jgi:hypothetical protein